MKKKILILFCTFVLALISFTACTSESTNASNHAEPFAVIYRNKNLKIYVDNETNVEYVSLNNGYGGVEFQPLYNADGTLKLYERK